MRKKKLLKMIKRLETRLTDLENRIPYTYYTGETIRFPIGDEGNSRLSEVPGLTTTTVGKSPGCFHCGEDHGNLSCPMVQAN